MKQHLIFIFILFFLVACKRDNSSGDLPDIYNYLTKDQIAKTPYFTNPDFDTLTFISNKGDTLIFAKQKTISSFYRTEITGCNGCASQYSNYQQLLNTYQTIKGNGKFEVKHSKKGIAYDRINDDFLTISFNEFTFSINKAMKKITLILLPFFIISIVKAQPCTKVNELNRKRH